MAKRYRLNPNQMTFDFQFEKKVDAYISAKQEILDVIRALPRCSG